MTVVLDKIQLRGHIAGLKEWNEGFEELEAISHSFAIQFNDGQGTWSAFSDSAEEKVRIFYVNHSLPDRHAQEKLLGLLYQASAL
jgi:hypothetical protein